MLHVLNVINSMGVLSGGPSYSTLLTAGGLRDAGVDVRIAAYAPVGVDKPISSAPFIDFLPPATNAFGYSPSYDRYLACHPEYDIYHIQGVWSYPGTIAARKARREGKPYIITPRGMLYPQDMAHNRLRKQAFMALLLRRDLRRASCILATARQEMEGIRALGITSPVAVIPNPVEMQEVPATHSGDLFSVGYLGRLHPRKNVHKLLEAWKMLGRAAAGCQLVIIGDGDKDYVSELKALSARLELDGVVFTGFLSGAERDAALASLSVLVVPSDFENFGNIVTQALSACVPVIASTGTPWEDLATNRCGWWVDNGVETIAGTIKEAMDLPRWELAAMGRRGRELIKEKYSTEKVASDMKRLYEWLACAGPRPEFVYM